MRGVEALLLHSHHTNGVLKNERNLRHRNRVILIAEWALITLHI